MEFSIAFKESHLRLYSTDECSAIDLSTGGCDPKREVYRLCFELRLSFLIFMWDVAIRTQIF